MNTYVTILGSGSALPTWQNSPACQVLHINDKDMMIDCGDGAQLAFRQMGMKTARLYNIFISHLHGDHCFGLIGLISTFGMMNRTQPLHIYAHPDLERLLQPMIDYYCKGMSYEVVFHAINPRKQEVIYEDRHVKVESVPLHHTVPACGFLFSELKSFGSREERTHKWVKQYAYISDTKYKPSIVEQIAGVRMLFHESTYTEQDAFRCPVTCHSTAKQAAMIADQASVGQLLIGHFSSRVDDHTLFLNEAQEIFPNTHLAIERQSFEIE